MTAYEIREREPGERLAGHLAIIIDGYDSFYTVDPSQFMAKATRELLARGVQPGPAMAVKAQTVCDAYARKALQRTIGKIRMGREDPAGGMLAKDAPVPGSMTDVIVRVAQGMTASEYAEWQANLRPEGDTVGRFMARGKLRNLRDDQWKAALKKPSEFTDKELTQYQNTHRLRKLENLLKKLEKERATVTSGSDRHVKLDKRIAEVMAEIQSLKVLVVAASHGFQYAFTQYWTAAIQLATDDIRIWPLMTNTTLDTVRDAVDTFSDVTADEFDGANYSSGGNALDNQAVAVDDANDRAEFDSDNELRSSLGAGTRSIQGEALGKFNTNTAGSLPLHWIEYASAKTPDGSDFTVVFNAEGILQMTG